MDAKQREISDSSLWRELRGVLPADTFEKLAAIAGHLSEFPKTTWQDLAQAQANGAKQRKISDLMHQLAEAQANGDQATAERLTRAIEAAQGKSSFIGYLLRCCKRLMRRRHFEHNAK